MGGMDSERRATYYVSSVQPITPAILAIAGDAIQNTRSTLDYLACALWSRTNTGECKIYFPITDSAAKYETESLGKVKGLRQDAVDAISAIEPYKGGKGDILWRLHHLSIIDKHRLPIAVVGANLGMHLPSLYPEEFPDSSKANPWTILTHDTICPLKENDVLFRDDPGRELKQELQLPFFVALHEVGVFDCKPLLPTLKSMLDFVNCVIADLTSLFP